MVQSEKIIQSLFDYAEPTHLRIRSGIQINEQIRRALSRPVIPSGIEVHEDLAEDLPAIDCDPDKMAQVIRNLLQNAVQAMPEGGRVTIWTRGIDPGRVELGVSDTGMGIARENLHRVFEPLYTTKAKGIGLGLALCRIHVEAHGGTVRVDSEEGQGTTYQVRLPVSPSDLP